MKKHLIFFLLSLVLVFSLQNCKYAKIDSIVNNSFEAGFTTINAKGRIIDYKDGTPTAHGHCYSATVEIPEIGLPGTDTTETPYQDVDFESKIDSLIFDEHYFVRPYMRNGTKIVYGEVQKMSTKVPSVTIKNFTIKDSLRPFSNPSVTDSIIEIEITTNEPSIVSPLSDTEAGREYGFVFGKAGDSLNTTNEILTNANLFRDLRFPSLPDYVIPPANNNRRNIILSLKRSNPAFPNNATGVTFFKVDPPSATPPIVLPVNFFLRAYLKLNRNGVRKFYYSERIKFRIK